MPHPLDGPRAKLAWAHHHIEAFKDNADCFFNRGGYAVMSNFDPDTEEHVIAVRIIENAPTERWALRIGDALHNLRSALDHLIYGLAIAGTGKDPPPNYRDLQFPIYQYEKGNNGYDIKAPKQLAGVSKPAKTVIKGVQPFDTPDAPLAILNALSNADKHRTLHITINFLRAVNAYDANTVGVQSAGGGAGYVHPITGERIVHTLYDGMELMRNRFGPPEVNRAANVKVDAAFDVLFAEATPKAVKHEVVIDLLKSLAQTTHEVIEALSVFV